jgi:hypothetical protein
MASRRRIRVTAALSAAVVVAGLAGCSSTSVLSLNVGDCLRSAELSGGQVSDVATVPCSEAHDAEVFAELSLPDGAYPGLEAVRTAAEDFCLPEFTEWAGITYLDSGLDVYPLLPTQDSWTGEDDRVILCIAVAPEDVTDTLEGSAR